MGWMGGSKVSSEHSSASPRPQSPEIVWGPAAHQLTAAWSLPGSAVVSLGCISSSPGSKELLLPPPNRRSSWHATQALP